jgi:hypothetical protein
MLREPALGERAGDEGGNFVDGPIVRFRRAGDNGNGRENLISPVCHLLHHEAFTTILPAFFSPARMRLPSISKIASVPFVAGLLIGAVGTAGAATVLGSDVFRDVPSGSYYDRAVGEMYDIGVIKGNPDKTFNPGGYVTRADVAVMLQRLRDEMTGNVSSSSRSSSSRSSSSSTSSSSSSSSSSSNSSLNPKGTIRFTTSEIRVPENISTKKVAIAVVRTGGASGEVTMAYTTGGGSATEGTDYTKSSGTLTFEGGDTSQTFDIAIKDDSSSEGNETITVTLSNPGGGASLGTPSTLNVIITDDESTSSSSSLSSSSSSSKGPTIGLSATQYSVDEDAGTVTITVTRGGSSSSAAAVNYATSNGSAKSGDEYTSTSGTLSFGAGEASKSFTVAVSNDTSDDGSKTFNVTLTSPTGATLASGLNTAVVTINDDETLAFGSGSFKFSRTTYNVTESSGEAVVTVQRTGGSAFAASVSYSTTSLTASSGTDYTATSGTLNFAAGEAAKIIVIPITKDTVADTGETFSVDLASPTGNVPLISPYSATVMIE